MKRLLLLIVLCLLSIVAQGAQAQSVDLLWQTDTYTPPFYKGRALWSNQSTITLVAIPHGLGNPGSLNYKWTRDDTVLGGLSGVDRNTITYTDSILSRPQSFKVEIMGSNESVLASATQYLAPSAPELLVYENNPLYGFMFNREMSGVFQLKGKEVTFTAFPLFFSGFSRFENFFSYSWRTNSGTSESQNSVTYRTPEDTSGTSQVSIKVLNSNKVVQSAEKSFIIKFGDE